MAKKVAKASTKKLPALSFRVHSDNAGGFKWALVNGENEVIAYSSAIAYPTEKKARAGVDAFRKLVKATATIPVLRADE